MFNNRRIGFGVLLLAAIAILISSMPVLGDIYQWEWIDPAHQELGKRQSTTLCPGGAGVNAEPSTDFDSRDLNQAYLANTNLSNAYFNEPNLTNADFSHSDLNGAFFYWAYLTNVDFSYADLSNVSFNSSGVDSATFTNAILKNTWLFYGLTKEQLYSTASYKNKDLAGIRIGHISSNADMSNWNFSNQNLTDVVFCANFTDAIFTDATIRNSYFDGSFTKEQLYSTASYKNKDISGVNLSNKQLEGWNFSNQNLSNVNFRISILKNTIFTNATVNGANFSEVRQFTKGQLYSTASYTSKDLSGINLGSLDLTGWNFMGQNLSNANFGSTFTGIIFDDSTINGANFYRATYNGFTSSQFYSTASYKNKNLEGVLLRSNNLIGWNFANQNLTNANFNDTQLTSTIFTDAIITGASFSTNNWYSPPRNPDITKEQLYSTASYKQNNLSRINMCAVDLTGWNFSNKNLSNSSFSWAKLANVDFSQAILFGSNLSSANMTNSNLSHTNLSNANFNYAEVENANLFCADARGAINLNLSDAITTNTILPDGSIQGLDLSGTVVLTVRDYDGDPIGYTDGVPIVPPHGPIPITVQTSLNMGTDGKLQMQFGDNAWDSTISFQAGIPVALGGTLDLAFAPGISSKSQLGQTLRLFNWTGVSPTGVFNVTSSYNWDLSKLYTSGDVTMLYDPTLANTRWTGAKNGNWNDTGNWTAGVPATGSIIEFNASAPTHQPVIQNISNPLSLNGIGFAPNAGTHILGGPTIQLAGDQPGIACASASDQYINNALELTSDTGFIVSGSGNLILGGNIFGSGSLIKIGSGVLILENSATYQGDTDIQAGILALDATGQIENSAVMNDATFKILSGDHTVGAITGAGETQVVSGSLAVDSLVQKMY